MLEAIRFLQQQNKNAVLLTLHDRSESCAQACHITENRMELLLALE